ncbi:MAG: AAA family ATPase [Chloroflexi bacterium]|nr:AAA family ATPase [Chloroflexota bacterium]
MPANRILLLDTDPGSSLVISGVLTAVGHTVVAVTDSSDAFRQAREHDLVIIDVVAAEPTATEVCREIRATPSLAAVPVLCISQTDDVEDRIRFLEAGADDVMARPFDARELEARVEALLLRFRRTRDLAPSAAVAPADHPVRRIVTVFSPKGGVGTTTIAVNVALAAARRHPKRTLLIDLVRQFGQVATHLDLTVRHTLADVVRAESSLREPETLRSFVTHYDGGLDVLPAITYPDLTNLVTAAHVEALLETAASAYDAVVVDGGSVLDQPALAALDGADSVIFAVHPEIAALKALHSLLDVLGELGSVGAKATFVLNDAFAKEILKMRDIEGALGTRIAAELPYDPFLYLKAVNEGVPIIRGAPRSLAAERLSRLADLVFEAGAGATVATPSADDRKAKRLGGLLRRT